MHMIHTFYFEDQDDTEVEATVSVNLSIYKEGSCMDVTIEDFEIVYSSRELTKTEQSKVAELANDFDWASKHKNDLQDARDEMTDRAIDEWKDSKEDWYGGEMINLLHGDCLKLMKQIPDKSVDFVLFNKEYFTPYMVIELDDSSHMLPTRETRDDLVGSILDRVGIKLVHVPVAKSYDLHEFLL